MATYYISNTSPTGNDSNPGTISQPWLTIGHAAANVSQDDVVNLNGGNTFGETSVVFSVGVTLQAYGTGRPTVALGTTNLVFNDCGGIILNNVDFTNSSTAFSGGASTEIVRINRTLTGSRLSGITATNCTFSGGQNGFRIYTSTSDNGGFNGITLSGCTFFGNSLTGFYIHGVSSPLGTYHHYSNVSITNNIAHDITGAATYGYGWGMNLACADTTVGPVVIQDNYAHDCGASATGSGGHGIGIQVLGNNGCNVSNNVCINISTGSDASGDGSAIDLDQGNVNCIIERNYCANSGSGLAFFSDSGFAGNVFRFNALIGCGNSTSWGAIHLSGSTDGDGGLSIYYNTIVVGSTRPGIYCVFGLNNKKIYNNLIIVTSGSPIIQCSNAAGGGFAADYNVYMGGSNGVPIFSVNSTTYTGMSAWRTFSAQDAHSSSISQCPFSYPLPANTTATVSSFAPLAQYCPVQGVAGTNVMTGGTNLNTTYGISYGTLDLLGNTLPANPSFVGCMSVYGSPPNAYAATVYSLAPVVSYRFAEPSGTISYDNGFGQGQLTLTSTTLAGAVLNPIDNGTSAVFNGSSSVGASPTLGSAIAYTALSVEAWIYPTSVAVSTGVILNWNGLTSAACNLLLNTTTLRFLVRDSSANICQGHPTGYTAVANALAHVVVVWGGSNTLVFYINSVPYAVTYDNTATPVNPAYTVAYIGNQSGFSRFYQGKVASLNIYPTALSAGQVGQLYEAGINGGAGPAMLMGG